MRTFTIEAKVSIPDEQFVDDAVLELFVESLLDGQMGMVIEDIFVNESS